MSRIVALCFALTYLIELASAQNIVIKNASIISMTSEEITSNQDLLIENGMITAIGKVSKKQTKNATIIDGSGKYVMPGLADMHVHLPELNSVDTLMRYNIAAGVTYLRVMNAPVSQTEVASFLSANPSLPQPKFYLSELVKRGTPLDSNKADSLVKSVENSDLAFIKLFSLADEATFDALMAAAKANDVIVCGHYPRYAENRQWKYVEVEKVLESGFKSIEHLAGYDAIPNDSMLMEIIKLTRENNVYNCPTLDWNIMAYDLLYPGPYDTRITYNSLPKSWIEKWTKDYHKVIDENGGAEAVAKNLEKYQTAYAKKERILKLLSDNDCPLLIGGDAGNYFQADGFNVHEEMKNWSNAGIDNYTILKSATLVPAQFFNAEKEWGTIEVGKLGNVILLDKNPLENIDHITTIYSTVLDGKVYTKEELLK